MNSNSDSPKNVTYKSSDKNEEEKPKKRKYTRRKKEETEEKPKRKYTRRKKEELPEKPKRKYTKRKKEELPTKNDLEETKHAQSIDMNVEEKIIIEPNSTRLNEKYIDLLEDLAYIMRKKKDFMRARAYSNAKETISNYNSNIIDPEQLKGKPGIGNTIFAKLVEYKETGSLPLLRNEESLLKIRKSISVFMDIYGIGEKKAEELVEKGIFTIDDLQKKKELLNDKQQIGLKYYNDILQRIPRSEIVEYEGIFRKNFPKGDGSMEIVGSYRRGASSSGDIDAIITSKDPETFKEFVDNLLKTNIIVEVLSRGPTKCLVITKLPSFQYARRVDFLYSPPDEYPFATLYFTGSKEFNTNMRERALKMGYTLNEHGFSKMEGRKKGDKVDRVFKDEEAIFNFLKMKYKTPIERNDPTIIEKGEGPIEKIPEIEPKPVKKVVIRKTVCKAIKKSDAQELIEEFKKNGIKVLEKASEKELAQMIDAANNAFHCVGKPLMSDNEYDIMREYMEKKYPKNASLEEVGAAVEKNKVQLPYEMWSMDKIKPDTDVLNNWMKKYKGPYVLSCKLDGVSGLYTTEGEKPKLYTRGDGKVGQDVTHLIPYLQLPAIKDVVIRGEFIIPKELFEEKYQAKFANPRNLVAGIVNQKTKDSKMKDIRFVAYEVIKYPGRVNGIKPSDQMKLLDHMNVETVRNQSIETISNDYLSDILQNWRSNYTYEIDGIIVEDDNIHPRVSGNPKHAFAFKMVLSDQIAEAHVVDVIWSASKDGYLKPRVQIMPIKLGGVTITYATGFNASFIETNKIGIGAIIMLVRSGDVIPYIKSVSTPAEKPKMPDIEYVWNDTHVDIMLKDKSQDATVLEKNITGFFKGLEVDGLGPGNVTKIINAGFNSIPIILHMSLEDFITVEGFKKRMAEKVHNSIKEKVEAASITKIAAASNTFGRGFSDKKIELIMDEYPNVLLESNPDIERIKNIKGVEKKTAEAFVDHIDDFKKFLKECKLESKLKQSKAEPKKEIDESHPLFGKTVVITGFRDKTLEEKLKEVGSKLGGSVSKKTFVVLVKNKDETSGKTEDAKKHNIPIMVFDDFMKKYF